jgi:hypothetical protein
MTVDLSGCSLKLEHACGHLEALQAQFRGYVGREPFRLARRRASDDRDELICRVLEPKPPFGLLIGDVVQNARSALDQLAWATSEEIDRRWVYFPIATEKPKKWSKTLAGFPPAVRSVIEAHQPFKYSGTEQQIHEVPPPPSIHPLAVLQALSNIDKHRLLTTSVAAIDTAVYGLEPEDLELALNDIVLPFAGLEDGVVLARFPTAPPHATHIVQLIGDLELLPVFDFPDDDLAWAGYAETVSRLDGRDVVEILGAVIERARTVVDQVRRGVAGDDVVSTDTAETVEKDVEVVGPASSSATWSIRQDTYI